MNIENNDDFLNEMLLGIPDLSSLSDSNDFDTKKSVKIDNECIEVDDEELASILLEIDRMNAEERNEKPLTEYELKEEKRKFEKEKKKILKKLELERAEFEQEKIKFERSKKEWESFKKLSEESFQAEKEEFEKYMQIEKEKMYLETMN